MRVVWCDSLLDGKPSGALVLRFWLFERQEGLGQIQQNGLQVMLPDVGPDRERFPV
jgi:hypothetical protein